LSTLKPKQVYTGPLQAVILDWAGTVVDYGCMGPAAVFVHVFAEFNIDVTIAEARRFMGLAKRAHVQAICTLKTVKAQWRQQHGRTPDEADIDALYGMTEPMMISASEHHCELIPGVAEAVDGWRRRGLRIGSTTGYTAPIMAVVRKKALDQGYAPDCMVCATDVPAGRPMPWMAYLNLIRLQIHPPQACIKIGDTISDIEEGLNAGMWTIGLTQSGNELGLTRDDTQAMAPDELEGKLAHIETRYRNAGAHYIVRGIWECPPLIDEIQQRLQQGEHPLWR
jgi:phosphonoacetaldehyde hydrolase